VNTSDLAGSSSTYFSPMPQPTVTELEPGVVRVTMPLPWALDHVHCYALGSPDGWTLVDAGLGTPQSLVWWEDVLEVLGRPAVTQLVLTHYHPDHLGASAGLSRLTGAGQVVQGRLDRALAVAGWEEGDDAEYERYLRHHGMPADLAAASTRAEIGVAVELAVPTRLVDEGDVVRAGGRNWRVLLVPGHADGHIALLDDEGGRLIGGDVLLDEITPNVGRWPDTAPDPLGRYLATLRRVADLAPTTVYPGHGPVIHSAATRADEIARHHDERLDIAAAALAEGAESAHEAAQAIWTDEPLGFHEQRFALVEAISHLERLAATGRAVEYRPARWRAAEVGV
jgi:glyoxylase-like metal-dependent hydrolase (beta-lactamase superfamily II)